MAPRADEQQHYLLTWWLCVCLPLPTLSPASLTCAPCRARFPGRQHSSCLNSLFPLPRWLLLSFSWYVPLKSCPLPSPFDPRIISRRALVFPRSKTIANDRGSDPDLASLIRGARNSRFRPCVTANFQSNLFTIPTLREVTLSA